MLRLKKITKPQSAFVVAIEYGHACIPRSLDCQNETYVLPNGNIVDLKAAAKHARKMHRFIEEQIQLASMKKHEGQNNA